MIPDPGRDGLLPLDKPVGPTSHDMVALARKRLGTRRIGHTGTLDPFASGLLLLCLGRATRLAEYLSDFPKEYVALARLGESTTTDDPEGETVRTSEGWLDLTSGEIAAALASLEGEQDQVPPSYSAKKVGGRTAYARARGGEAVRLEPVPVSVHGIQLEEVNLPLVRFRVRCSTGTYIRAIARDLGDRLGVGAHLIELRRLGIGPYRVDHALGPEALDDPTEVERARVSPADAVAHLPRIDVEADEARRLEAGQSLVTGDRTVPDDGGELSIVFEGRLLAMAVRSGDRIRPRKVFPAETAS